MSPLKKRRPSSSTFLGSVDSGAAAAQSCGSSFEGVFSRYTVTTHCDHRFHLDCLQSTRSFEMSNCPMCREEVPPGITPAKKSAIAGSRPLYGGVNVLPSAANSASSPSALRDAAHNGAGGLAAAAAVLALASAGQPGVGQLTNPNQPPRYVMPQGLGRGPGAGGILLQQAGNGQQIINGRRTRQGLLGNNNAAQAMMQGGGPNAENNAPPAQPGGPGEGRYRSKACVIS